MPKRERSSANALGNNRGAAMPAMPAMEAYERSMVLIRARFIHIAELATQDAFVRAEQIGLQVRKIIESVAFSALSAAEHRNGRQLGGQRTRDAADILKWLDKKGMLKLPCACRVAPSIDPIYKAEFNGNGSVDLDREVLESMFSRASALVHERHPERLPEHIVRNELQAIEEDSQRLRDWLWLHMIFHKNELFLVQMGQFGTPSFFGSAEKVAELPEGY
jgi:hypothetical protein